MAISMSSATIAAAAISALASGATAYGNAKMSTHDRAVMQEFAKEQMQRQFDYNKQIMKMQQDYETEMSNTAHQREVADLTKAGLNPILSANGGASTPGAAAIGVSPTMASSSRSPMENPLKDTLGFVQAMQQNRALDIQEQSSEVGNQKMQAERDYIEAQKNTELVETEIRKLDQQYRALEILEKKGYLDKQDQILASQIKSNITAAQNNLSSAWATRALTPSEIAKNRQQANLLWKQHRQIGKVKGGGLSGGLNISPQGAGANASINVDRY